MGGFCAKYHVSTKPAKRPDQRQNPNDLARVYVATESRLGLPAGTRFFSRLTSDSLFELSLAKTDKGMKIVWAQVYPFN